MEQLWQNEGVPSMTHDTVTSPLPKNSSCAGPAPWRTEVAGGAVTAAHHLGLSNLAGTKRQSGKAWQSNHKASGLSLDLDAQRTTNITKPTIPIIQTQSRP